MKATRLHAVALACLTSLGAALLPTAAQAADPFASWQTASTPHFRIHYRAEERAQAEAVARIAEKVYPRITQAFAWEPRGGTEVVVSSELDLSNGSSTPLPFSDMTLYLAPPDSGELLDNSAWLELLITHELVHIVHLDKVRGAPKVLQTIFGRVPWFFPNVFEPTWVAEGLAVLTEGDAAERRGRLHSPLFDAWLATERQRGFLSLREINADGRALPLTKNYLYGSYFFDWLQRTHGKDAPYKFVENYSGNIVPRFHSNPWALTGKMMDELWDDFLADLTRQVDARQARLTQNGALPEQVGAPLTIPGLRNGPLFDVGGIATTAEGRSYAIVEDGLRAAQLVSLDARGQAQRLASVKPYARVDVAADGSVLVAQPDICNAHYLVYDLYRLEASGGLTQLTSCQRLRRGVVAGTQLAALQHEAGRTRLVLMDRNGQGLRSVWQPSPEVDLIDLAASPDGRSLTVVARWRGDWRLLQFDLEALAKGPAGSTTPRLLARLDAPVHSLRHGPQGLEFISERDGAANVWRLLPGSGGQAPRMQRLTHSLSAVAAQGGSARDGSLTLAVLAPGGQQLRRLPATSALQTVTLASDAAPGTPAQAFAHQPAVGTGKASAGSSATASTATASTTSPAASGLTPGADPGELGPGGTYWAWRTLYPRSWLPTIVTNDRGLRYFGASTFGSDALEVHQYAANFAWETRQKEGLGSFEYLWNGSQHLALTRTLTPRAWVGASGKETTTVYERGTQAQWLSLLPWLKLERRVVFGLGAALDRIERVTVANGSTPANSQRTQDNKIAAALVDLDTSNGHWYSEGPNRGQRTSLLYETYKPFAKESQGDLDGSVLRLDARAYLPLGNTVLALKHTEARAHGRTERFQLGGAYDPQLQLGYQLNQRDIALRGYEGTEARLQGASARVSSIEWRTPLRDVDRHFMVPPVGLDRLSLTTFFDIGGAWDTGHKPASYSKGVGVELIGEVKLLYALGLQLRLGVARGLDEPKGTQAYLTAGRAF